MNIKQFLKPDKKRIVLVIIFLGLSLLYLTTEPVLDTIVNDLGGPLHYLKISKEMIGTNDTSPPVFEFFYINLLIDIIFWYLISCFIILIYDKLKKKK